MTTRSQEIVRLFIDGKSIKKIRDELTNKYYQITPAEEIESILRKALRRHGRQGRKAK